MPAPAESPPRKRFHDLDALRACAMLPGVLLHATFHTIPWRYFDRPVLPGGPNVWALPCFHGVQLIHGLRMPVFFLPGGFFCALLWQRRGLQGLLKNRVLRIALPLLICIPTIRNLEYIINRLTRGQPHHRPVVQLSRPAGPQQPVVSLATAASEWPLPAGGAPGAAKFATHGSGRC